MTEHIFPYGNYKLCQIYRVAGHRIALEQNYGLINVMYFVDEHGTRIEVPEGFTFFGENERQRPEKNCFFLTWVSKPYVLMYANQSVLRIENVHTLRLTGDIQCQSQ